MLLTSANRVFNNILVPPAFCNSRRSIESLKMPALLIYYQLQPNKAQHLVGPPCLLPRLVHREFKMLALLTYCQLRPIKGITSLALPAFCLARPIENFNMTALQTYRRHWPIKSFTLWGLPAFFQRRPADSWKCWSFSPNANFGPTRV